jgi:hypothetical protein
MFSKYSLEFKLAGIMAVALVISSVLSNTVFLANTPRINKPFLAKVIGLPGTIIKNTGEFMALLLKPASQQNLANLNPQPTTVYSPPSIVNRQPTIIVRQPSSSPSLALILRQLSQGVFAEEDTKNKIIYIKVTSNDPWQEKQMVVNGQTVTIRAPIGTWK